MFIFKLILVVGIIKAVKKGLFEESNRLQQMTGNSLNKPSAIHLHEVICISNQFTIYNTQNTLIEHTLYTTLSFQVIVNVTVIA